MEINNTYEAVRAIKTHLLTKHKFGFFNWVEKNKDHILPNIKMLESSVDRLIKQEEAIEESDKRRMLNILQKFLRELDAYYSQHTDEEELEKLGKILHVEKGKEISLKKVDNKLIEVAKWFTNNRIGVKINRVAANIDPEFKVESILGWGEFGVVLKVKKGGKHYALKVALDDKEEMGFKHPVLGKFKNTFRDEFEIMKDLWKNGLEDMPKPFEFYDSSPSFNREKIGPNAFLMEYLEGKKLNLKDIGFKEHKEIINILDKIHKARYTIPPDFIENFLYTKEGLKILDFAGFHKYKKHKEEEIKKYESGELKKLGGRLVT